MNKDRIGGIFFAAIGVVVVLMAMQIRMPANLNEPGPRIFPYIAGGGMILCGLGMILTAKKDDKKTYLTKDGWIKLVKALVVIFIYYLGLRFLGFLISTPFFAAAVILLLSDGKKVNKITTVIVAILTTGIVYFLFEKVFSILLPSGVLFY